MIGIVTRIIAFRKTDENYFNKKFVNKRQAQPANLVRSMDQDAVKEMP